MNNTDRAMTKLAEEVANLKYEQSRIKAQEMGGHTGRPRRREDPKVLGSIRNEAPAADDTYTFADARRDVADGGTTQELLWSKQQCKDFVDYAMENKAAGPYTETTSAGGYLVPTELKPELVRLAYLKSLALQKARLIPMVSNTMNVPTLATQATIAWGAINTSIGDTANEFGQMSLTAEKATAFSLVPNELLRDSSISVAQIIVDEFTEAMAKFLDEEWLQGDTADASNHKFNGFEFAANVHNLAGDTGDSVDGVLTFDNIVDTMGYLDAIELNGAEFFMHPSVWARIRKLVDSQSRPLVDISGGYKYDLLGHNVNLSNQASATAASIAAGRAVLMFANPKYGYIGEALTLNIESSDQYKFQTDQTAFRCVQRFAIDWPLGSSMAMMTRGPA